MDKKIIDRILKITTGIAIISLLIILFTGGELSATEALKRLLTIFSITTLFWAFYFRFGWRWPLIKYIIFKENLNGTWFGEYKSKDLTNGNLY